MLFRVSTLRGLYQYDCFNYSYTFNRLGEIVSEKPRHFTDRNQYETARYRRIAIEAVYDYNDKDNRQLDQNLSKSELGVLYGICSDIAEHGYSDDYKNRLIRLVESIEAAAIRSL